MIKNLEPLVPLILGEGYEKPIYKTGRDLVEYFNSFGFKDDYNDLVAQDFSKKPYTKEKLCRLRDNESALRKIIEDIIDPGRFIGKPENKKSVLAKLEEILRIDGFFLKEQKNGSFKLQSQDLDELTLITKMDKIQPFILEHIQSAKYLVWIAVAWVTNREIIAELKKCLDRGVDVQIIVNDDEKNNFVANEISGVKKTSPTSNFKNLMHLKCCIIDLKTVLTGSYNWTNAAEYNDENIHAITGSDVLEDYLTKFNELRARARSESYTS